MPKATADNSKSRTKKRSAVFGVKHSGYDLVKSRKKSGRLVSIRQLAKQTFVPSRNLDQGKMMPTLSIVLG